MPPHPLENRVEHRPCQASGLGILLTWVIGNQEDRAIGEPVLMAMSELHLLRGPHPPKHDL
jgi:hypothetical protein